MYYTRQWVECNGIPRPEIANSETPEDLLDKEFDSLTKEQWEFIKANSSDDGEF